METGGSMEALPDGVVEHILGYLDKANNVAACACVCKPWRDFISNRRRLVFPRNLGVKADNNLLITRMVIRRNSLEELVIFCQISAATLLACICHARNTLKLLEIRLDTHGETARSFTSSKLECINSIVPHLETLKLWGGVFHQRPSHWRTFSFLHTLEIVGARIKGDVAKEFLSTCPALKNLALLGCDGIRFMTIDQQQLESCRLDICCSNVECSVLITSPKLRLLEVQGASSLRVPDASYLEYLTVAKQCGIVTNVEVGRLPVLQSLTLRGVQWSWPAVERLLNVATGIEKLCMKVEFCGGEKFEPFPEVDFVEFFLTHPKLKAFDVHGAMFAALTQKTQMLGGVLAPSLEELNITARSPLNPEKKLRILESLIQLCPALRKLVIRVTQMRNCETEADEFFADLLRLQSRYRFITIE